VTSVFSGYRGADGDEAVDPSGALRDGYAVLGPALDRLGETGLADAASGLAAHRRERGVVLGTWSDGRQRVRPLPMDPVPRLLPAEQWTRVAAGVEQRHRALNAFLADAYRAAGRRKGDPDRAPEVVRAGVLPEWAVAHSPGRDPDAVGLAWRGQHRAAIAGMDVVATGQGSWRVLQDDLRVPVGIGYALANRETLRAAVPELFATGGAVPADPRAAVPLLLSALHASAPPECPGDPECAVLSAGEVDGAWFEHGLLGEALGAPVVRPGDLWPRPDGGIDALVDGERIAVDVLYRRFDDAELGAHRTASGQPLTALLAEGVRSGRLGLTNVPGNGLADDKAMYAWVPGLIRFYLGEEPLLESVRTWVLADDAQWAEVRERLHELVLKPVDGYGGSGVVVGPLCSAAELAQLQAEVAAAPHRFVAQEPVEFSTAPTVVEGRLRPRSVDLRVFSVAGARTRALPAPLTRVSLSPKSVVTSASRGGGSKDTWILPPP
jgi:carboxylate-amine ligase